MFYDEILIDLTNHNVKFLLVGGMAVNLHGFDRTTGDLDVLLYMKDENLKKFMKVVKKWKLAPSAPININDFLDKDKRNIWINEKNMNAFSLINPNRSYERLDVVIESPIDFNEAFSHGKKIVLDNIKITICSIEDLIKMKKHANREIDKLDIKALKKIQELNNNE